MVLFIEEIWPLKVYYMYRIHVNEREKMKFRYLLSEFIVNIDDSEHDMRQIAAGFIDLSNHPKNVRNLKNA